MLVLPDHGSIAEVQHGWFQMVDPPKQYLELRHQFLRDVSDERNLAAGTREDRPDVDSTRDTQRRRIGSGTAAADTAGLEPRRVTRL